MRAFLAAMAVMVVITIGANWALERGPLTDLTNPSPPSVRLD